MPMAPPSRHSVLVVAGESRTLAEIRELLADEFVVSTTSDPNVALRALENTNVAVVLTDHDHDRNLVAAPQFLGAAQSVSTATRVLMSDRMVLDKMGPAIDHGLIQAFLAKPWTPLELKVAVRAAADRWQLSQPSDDAEVANVGRMGELQAEVEHLRKIMTVLRRDRDRALADSQAKTRFLANFSHELRAPLNAIIGFTELAESQLDDTARARIGEYLANSGEAAQYLLQLINEMLDSSRMEAGAVILHESDVVIGNLVATVLRLVSPLAIAKKLSLIADLPPDLPPCRGDLRLLKQILLNVVTNAVKFTPAGGQVRVSGQFIGGAVSMTVADTGIGIAPEDMALVLRPFGRVENGDASLAEGTGLGLPLAKGFMELHGGTLGLESSPGEGTRVILSFPPSRTIHP